jgi:hypothetical protein
VLFLCIYVKRGEWKWEGCSHVFVFSISNCSPKWEWQRYYCDICRTDRTQQQRIWFILLHDNLVLSAPASLTVVLYRIISFILPQWSLQDYKIHMDKKIVSAVHKSNKNICTITWRYQSFNQLQWQCRMLWAITLLTLTNPPQNSRLRKSGHHRLTCRLHIVHLPRVQHST